MMQPGNRIENCNRTNHIITGIFVILTALCLIIPMGQLPLWNGEQPGHRNQYELMAEAILDGRIDFKYGDEENLQWLENPYDPAERESAGVYYHWDHAYYNGHYYMYFGIIPVLLVFLPFRILTGTALTTYHATQLFAGMSVVGIFVLFYLLAKLFFKKMPYLMYLALSVAFSVMSLWYSSAEPALYCTAITAAIGMEVWSLYFFIRAVWKEKEENRQLVFAGIGACFGALAFGCRPPIALANILVIPMLARFLKEREFSVKLLGKLILAAMPYVIVGVGLMIYNYVRFENPFEFGQAYQLTVADQSNYQFVLNFPTIVRIWNNTVQSFFEISQTAINFPYLSTGGIFFNFPILLLWIGMGKSEVRKKMQQSGILALLWTFLGTTIFVTTMDIIWTPYLLERYHMDIYFLMGIGCFIMIGLWYESCEGKMQKIFHAMVCVLAIITVISSVLYCIDTIGVYYPDIVSRIGMFFSFN